LVLLGVLATKEQRVKEKYHLEGNIVPTQGPALAFLMLLDIAATLSGAYVAGNLYGSWPRWGKVAFGFGAFLIYSSYLQAVVMAVTKKVSREDLEKERSLVDATDYDPIDADDERIVGLEAQISSISQRVESYTLESALFGALAFSAFVTLVASERLTLSDLRTVTSAVMALIERLVQTGFVGATSGLYS
jgi:3-methyladenine DNA glycosylase/8-oxoguanine DNA glycosylase